MGESVSKRIKDYEDNLYNNQVKKIIEGFETIRKRIINNINGYVRDIAANLKKNKQYDNMMSGISSFKNEIKGKMSNPSIDGYDLDSENSAKEITTSKLENTYQPDDNSLSELTKRITECEKEALTKQSYYSKWLGGGQTASTTSLRSLIGLYNYDKSNSSSGGDANGSQLKLANVLKNQKITATLDNNQGDANYLTLKSSLKEDAEQNVEAIIKTGAFEFKFAKNDYIVDNLLVGTNQCLLKLQAYKNYCDTVWMVLSNYLYGTDDNSQDSFARKMDDFFGPGKIHSDNKANLKEKNAQQRELAEKSGETFADERLEDYYYKEGTSAPYFEKFKDRANEYDKKLDERKNFIKSFCDEFDSSFSPFRKESEVGQVGELELDNQKFTDEIQSQDGVSVELQNLEIVDVKIEWGSIFPKEVQGPWAENWENEKTTVDVGGDTEVEYPLAFDKFDSEFNGCAQWLKTLKTDIDRLYNNIDTMKSYKDKIAAEIARLKAEEEARAAEEAAREAAAKAEEEAKKAAEEAAKRAEEEAQRRQEELDAIKDAMKGGDD